MRFLLLAAIGGRASEGYCSGQLDEVEPCNTQSCTLGTCTPVDAAWGDWHEWGDCSCTSMIRDRHRPIKVHAKCGGAQISGAQAEAEACTPDAKACDLGPMPTDCATSAWSAWSTCECGRPQVFRTRVVTAGEHCGKTCDAPLQETRPCDQAQFAECNPVKDCAYTEWEEWGECPVTCGGAQATRVRKIVHPSQNGGAPCLEPLAETRACSTACCAGTEPVDCAWGSWGAWSGCSAECEGGTRSRSRGVAQFARNGGAACAEGALQEYEACNPQSCNPKVPVDGKWGDWSEFGPCSEECGGGYRSRARKVAVEASHGGRPLEGAFEEFERCHEQPCTPHDAVDCEFSAWSPWTECSCKCNGKHEQSRDILKHGKNGGKVCEGGLTRWEACNVPGTEGAECDDVVKQPCTFKEWSQWSECSASCAGGVRTRTREPNEAADMLEACSGSVMEVEQCNGMSCFLLEGEAVDCVWGAWTEWGDCTVSCGSGQTTSYRHVLTGAKYAGKPCDASGSMRIAACNTEACAPTGYCAFSEWTPWSNCTKPCNGGQRMRAKTLETRTGAPPAEYLDSYSLVQLQREVAQLHVQLGARGALALGLVLAIALLLRRGGRNVDTGPSFELLSPEEREVTE